MKFKIIWKSSRAVCIELVEEDIVYTDNYTVFIDGEPMLTSDRVVQSIYGLKPDTEYRLTLSRGDQTSAEMTFQTEPEFVTLNVRDFGARGDDVHNGYIGHTGSDPELSSAQPCVCSRGHL